jgi:hypothetical protein
MNTAHQEKTIQVTVRPVKCGQFMAHSPIGKAGPADSAVSALKLWVEKYVSSDLVAVA